MSNVLLTCVGRRNYLALYFKEVLGESGTVVGADMNKTAPGLVDCDRSHIVPNVYDESYIDTLLSICDEEKITLLVGLNDLELPILAKNRERFVRAGVEMAVSEVDVILRCADKHLTYHWLRENNIPTPLTYIDLGVALAAIENEDFAFPCIVKPRWGSGSIGVFTVHDVDELRAAHALVLSTVRRGMLATASSEDIECSVLMQAKCPGTEFGCDILNDFNKETQAVVTKEKYGMRAGETDKAIVRNDILLKTFCEKLGNISKHIGNLDCDIFVDGSDFHVLEMNPRFGGGYPFSHVAGAEFPRALVNWSKGEDFDTNLKPLKYNEVYSKFDTLRRVADA